MVRSFLISKILSSMRPRLGIASNFHRLKDPPFCFLCWPGIAPYSLAIIILQACYMLGAPYCLILAFGVRIC